jgi:glucosamine-6-phosphate deaminase
MDIMNTKIENFPSDLRAKISVVEDVDQLNRAIAAEFADMLEEKQRNGELLTAICPVGPLEYGYFAKEVIGRGLSCRFLRTVNMDEYLDENDKLIPVEHPLSFHRFMEETFFSHLPDELRPLPENIVFPDPDAPEKITELIDSIGGADICWAGFGITGHVAFNDPPSMLGEPDDLESFKNSKTRAVTNSPMSTAQMLMGGTNGNSGILPKRAITIGMYEMLKSKKFHLTFMRNWHAGLWRQALLGPVTQNFPGSLLQEHPNLQITMTELAAEVPLVNTAQATGEE